ncbi:MAG TPA: hypothetical protein VFF63_03835 [Candidatus Babeliales bacterium]|nr:hypothetical protein [Candidatus Babeliales bacterium]
MKLGAWRATIVLAVAVCAVPATYEFVAPTVDFTQGDVRLEGSWLDLPGSARTTFLVVSAPAGSNLAAAGIISGDRFIPDDSLQARWTWAPGDRIAGSVVRGDSTRRATIVAVAHPVPWSWADWVLRVGRLALQIAMLALAIVLAWHVADAPWVRWLCAYLVCVGFAPWQIDRLEYVGPIRAVAISVEDTVVQVGICIAMIFAVAIRGSPVRDFRMWMVRLAPVAFLVLEIGILVMFMDPRALYYTPPFRAVQAICVVAAIAALTAAAAESKGQERQRLRYIAWTFGVGFSGFFVSIAAMFALGNTGANLQAWFIPRLTLLMIPIGLGYGLLSHRVVSSHYIASRTLVYGAITSSLVPIFAAAEWTATNVFGQGSSGKNVFLVSLAVLLTASFKSVHKRIEKFIDQLIFKQRHVSEQALTRFAKEVGHIDDAAILAHRCAGALDEYVGAVSTALYLRGIVEPAEERPRRGADYVRVVSAGDPSPKRVKPLDAIVVSLKSEADAVESELLGTGGYAFPMISRGALVGFLAIGPKRDGEILSPDELKRLTQLAHEVAVALEGIRLSDLESQLAEARNGRAELQRLLADLVHTTGPAPSAASES